ncbi:hypothetical protein [Spirosoma montaniterrae]|uniref:BZIP transcription factor n=1 Tax=Spirosoma montaniterrae TaxID=1178516 RepID=A0A1P9WWR1_9BACT|nr:hypothetical protein [Spirosoma montaniterrae]AQG79819.1 hypothetical protein AWR27_11080 [Spirosoma montaniterrae]
MKISTLFTIGTLTLPLLGYGQGQIITPDNQTITIHSVGGSYNLFIGQSTSPANGTVSPANSGTANTFMGNQAGQGNTTGSNNTYYGYKTGSPGTTGSNNTLVGVEAGKLNITGNDNVFMGWNSGRNNRNGNRNVIMGIGAGFGEADGNDNTLLGANAIAAGENLSNATAIGANARVLTSNALVLGNNVNVGIGNSAPQNRLELTAGIDGRSGLRLTNLTANSPTEGTAAKFLTVTDKGDVMLSGQLSATAMRVQPRSEGQWADFVFAPSYQLPSLTEVERYIRQHKHLPGLPSAANMVKEGTDLTTLLATLVQKNEELTLHLIEQQKRIERLEQQNRELQKK